jgi:anti-sigma-K factor RskA
MSNPIDRNPDITDPTLEQVAGRLDALGSADRSQPRGLEDRVMAAIAQQNAPMPIAFERPTVWWRSAGVRLAAAVAIVASGAAILLVSQPIPQPPSADAATNPSVAALEERIEGMFIIGELAAGDSFDDSIASLDLWVDALDTELTSGWQSAGYADEWFGEGAL